MNVMTKELAAPTKLKQCVLYHAECTDGFASAWSAYRALGRKDVLYIPVKYGENPPTLTGSHMVYILDFSYDSDTLRSMDVNGHTLRVIDHHVSRQKDLENYPYATFDLNKSGAVMSWEYFHSQDVPDMLLYIQDRDLWQWKLPHSEEINAYLSVLPFDFEVWDKVFEQSNLDMISSGVAILAAQKKHVEKICDNAYFSIISGHKVPTVCTSVLNSEVGHELLKRNPRSKFVASWYQNAKGDKVYSLRSRKDEFDVSKIAANFDGGGLKSTAQFIVKASNER